MPTLQDIHEKAAQLYEDRNLDEALALYEEIIKYNPIDEVALSCIMDIYLEKDDKFNYYLARANVNISQHKLEYAINDTKKALELDMDNIDARRKLARLYKTDKKNLKAIDEFNKILSLSKNEIDVYFELVELYMREDSIDSAISIARKGLEIFPEDKDMRNMLAQLYFKANDYDNALEVVEDDFLRAKILLQAERNEEAREIIEKYNPDSLEKEIDRKKYYILKAQYLYNTKSFEEALVAIDEYSKINVPDALSFQMRALIYEELNDDFKAHVNWGFCSKLQGKYEEAMVEFNNAYQMNPKDKTVLIELANLYQQNKERFVAIEFWEKVYAIDKDEQAREILAEFYYSEGNFDKAEEYGKKVERKEENYSGIIDKIMAFFSKE